MQAHNYLTELELKEQRKQLDKLAKISEPVMGNIFPTIGDEIESAKQKIAALEEQKYKEVESNPDKTPDVEKILKSICARTEVACSISKSAGHIALCPNIKYCKRKLRKIVKQLTEQASETID